MECKILPGAVSGTHFTKCLCNYSVHRLHRVALPFEDFLYRAIIREAFWPHRNHDVSVEVLSGANTLCALHCDLYRNEVRAVLVPLRPPMRRAQVVLVLQEEEVLRPPNVMDVGILDALVIDRLAARLTAPQLIKLGLQECNVRINASEELAPERATRYCPWVDLVEPDRIHVLQHVCFLRNHPLPSLLKVCHHVATNRPLESCMEILPRFPGACLHSSASNHALVVIFCMRTL
mmetsp:Transcript_1416/g.3847  ORF Transcript_1416/g.3847 Transcript_1416/m.3847 type:complete len:234 (+) Transcript_1416:640-1341(+)